MTTVHRTPCFITELTTAVELGNAFRDIFQSALSLRVIPSFAQNLIRPQPAERRTKSLASYMATSERRKNCGVLLDLDEIDDKSLNRLKAKETLPYMALELLELVHHASSPYVPCYRLDLESLLYAMVFVSCQYHEGKEIARPKGPFEQWLHWDLACTEFYRRKSTSLSFAVVPAPTSNFTGFMELFHYLRKLFRDGYLAQADVRTLECAGVKSPFDPETLGGRVTFDTFQKILDEHLPRCT
ncbi:hypothetical protein C8R45DRAFT_921684 [Mycena sanguinolenta]|nr:hypothetical protein C8R45DRAFT_921684 [Mycena sanguinolenta]